MLWLKRNRRKAGIAFAGLLLPLALWMWLMLVVMLAPVSAAGTYERASGLAGPGTVTLQTPSTVDLIVTAVALDMQKQNDEKLKRDNSGIWPWLNTMGGSIGTILLAAAAIVSTIIGFSQWRGNRNDERKKEKDAQDKELKDRQEAQDKELRAQAEERFRAAVIALGDEKESVQVGGAILLRSFLNKDDEKIYGRYYTQVFDLAVAYLRLVRTSPPSIDPDGLPPPSVDSNIPLPLTTFREALIVVFKEAFPLARYSNSSGKGAIQSLNARGIRLDYAYLQDADLKRVWMPRAVLRNANLIRADFSEANLTEADVRNVDLRGAVLTEADLRGSNLRNSDLRGANLRRADLRTVWFHGAFLNSADLRGAKFGGIGLSGVHFVESATSLAGTDLRGATGLTQEQKKACKAKGAIIDEDTTANPSQSTVATSQTLQSNDAPAPSAASAQVNTQTPTKDGSSSATSQPSVEP